MSARAERLGVLGGTFDPPHAGHRELARIALAADAVDAVLLVPCLRHRLGKEPTPFAHRVAMCELLIADEPAMAVSRAEERLVNPGRTLDLVAALAAERPAARLRLLAGSDLWFERDRWYRFAEIERLAPPLWVARRGVPPIPAPTLPAPPEVSSSGIRARIAAGAAPAELLPPAVAAYVARHRLYGCAG